ncbi:MAG: hypothetical protein ACQEQU_04400 [Spirochaetota bacterium]
MSISDTIQIAPLSISDSSTRACALCGRRGGKLKGADGSCFSCIISKIDTELKPLFREKPNLEKLNTIIAHESSLLVKARLIGSEHFFRQIGREVDTSLSLEHQAEMLLDLLIRYGEAKEHEAVYLTSAIMLQLFLIPILTDQFLLSVSKKGAVKEILTNRLVTIVRLYNLKAAQNITEELRPLFEGVPADSSFLNLISRLNRNRIILLLDKQELRSMIVFLYQSFSIHCITWIEAFMGFQLSTCIQSVETLYPTEQLKEIFKHYIKPVLEPARIPFELPRDVNRYRKQDLINCIATYLTTPILFCKMFDAIREDEQQLLSEMFLTGCSYRADQVIKLIGRSTVSKRRDIQQERMYSRLLPFCHLRTSYSYRRSASDFIFIIPYSIRKVLSRSYAIEYELNEPEAREPGSELIILEGEENLKKLPDLELFIRTTELQRSKTNENLLLKSLKELQLVGEIQEPYTGNDFKFMKTNLLGDLIETICGNLKKDYDGYEQIVEDLLQHTFIDSDHSSMTVPLINYLGHITSGYSWVEEREDHRFRLPYMVGAILHLLPQDGFIPLDEIIRHLGYQKTIPRPLSCGRRSGDYRIRGVFTSYGIYEQKINPTEILYYETITRPYTALLMTILHLLGFVDLAYTPEVDSKIHLPGKNYLSRYDGVSACRLSSYGAYFIGKDEEFNGITSSSPNPIIRLDDRELVIRVEHPNTTTAVLLKRFAEQVGVSLYTVRTDTFLEGCYSSEELSEKIEQFKKLTSQQLPARWQRFFSELESSANTLHPDTTPYIIYHLDAEDLKTREIFTQDEYLKSVCIRATGPRIIIPRKEYKKVSLTCRGYGILIPPLIK